MELVVLSLSVASLIAIGIMIASLLLGYVKRLMMTYALIIGNLFVFLLSMFYENNIINELGFRPIYLSVELLPNIYTLFTSMFVHSGFLHILGNMFVFFFMGVAFEQRIGRTKFLAIYLITGVCGALTHSLLNFNSSTALVGASGAIFGILGAFAYAYPRDEVVMPVPIGIMFIMRIKVIYATILFAVLETVIVMLSVNDNTAHFAHLGGLASGVLIAAIILRKKTDKTKNPNATEPQDYMFIKKSDKINFSKLTELAQTPELKKMLQHIEHETVLQVRDIWLEHFLEKTTCPVCNKPLNHFERNVWCDQNHYKTSY